MATHFREKESLRQAYDSIQTSTHNTRTKSICWKVDHKLWAIYNGEAAEDNKLDQWRRNYHDRLCYSFLLELIWEPLS